MIARLRSVRRDGEAGFTLVELLVTMSIMAIAFIVMLGAISVFFSSTRVHRASAELDAAMRTYVEKLADAPYVDCATSTSYNSVSVPAGFAVSVQPKYWDGIHPNPAVYGPTCPTPDKGAQQLTVTMTRNSDGQKDRIIIVKRDEVQP
jgi:prepilin-type N-terminal cleavage/methylation domain-containing protein